MYDKINKKGITFNTKSKNDVIDILSTKNYYYRLTSYRKNFKKDSDGNYIGLDFDALTDLASIDTYLREYLLSLALDVEHALKTILMKHITNNIQEDGYSLITEFKIEHLDYYTKTLNHFKRNHYKNDMFNKRKCISIWVFLEVIDFGTLSLLIDHYSKKYPYFNKLVSVNLIRYVKNIRNACAHNDVFLINLFRSQRRTFKPTPQSVSYGSQMGINRSELMNIKIHDLVILIQLHKTLCSEKLNDRRYKSGQNVIKRMNKNIYLYNKSSDYKKFIRLYTQCVDFLNPHM